MIRLVRAEPVADEERRRAGFEDLVVREGEELPASRGIVARLAELFGCPQAQQLVPACFCLELLFLVERELLLETFLALVKRRHISVP